MEFRDKLLSGEIRHITEMVNMLSYEFIILQDFLLEVYGNKLRRFRERHVFGGESNLHLAGGVVNPESQRQRVINVGIGSSRLKSSGTAAHSGGQAKRRHITTTGAGNSENSATADEIVEDPLSVDNEVVQDSSFDVITATEGVDDSLAFITEKDEGSDFDMNELSEDGSEDDKADNDYSSSTIWDHFTWKRLPNGQKIVQCPKCHARVSAVAARMRKHRANCIGLQKVSKVSTKLEPDSVVTTKPAEGPTSEILNNTPESQNITFGVGKPKGMVWHHFEKRVLENGHTLVTCNYCKGKVSNHATRMSRHLQKCTKSPIASSTDEHMEDYNAYA